MRFYLSNVSSCVVMHYCPAEGRKKNVLLTLIAKRRSIIAPKSHDNYLVSTYIHLIASFAIFNYFFWRFNSKIYGTRII